MATATCMLGSVVLHDPHVDDARKGTPATTLWTSEAAKVSAMATATVNGTWIAAVLLREPLRIAVFDTTQASVRSGTAAAPVPVATRLLPDVRCGEEYHFALSFAHDASVLVLTTGSEVCAFRFTFGPSASLERVGGKLVHRATLSPCGAFIAELAGSDKSGLVRWYEVTRDGSVAEFGTLMTAGVNRATKAVLFSRTHAVVALHEPNMFGHMDQHKLVLFNPTAGTITAQEEKTRRGEVEVLRVSPNGRVVVSAGGCSSNGHHVFVIPAGLVQPTPDASPAPFLKTALAVKTCAPLGHLAFSADSCVVFFPVHCARMHRVVVDLEAGTAVEPKNSRYSEIYDDDNEGTPSISAPAVSDDGSIAVAQVRCDYSTHAAVFDNNKWSITSKVSVGLSGHINGRIFGSASKGGVLFATTTGLHSQPTGETAVSLGSAAAALIPQPVVPAVAAHAAVAPFLYSVRWPSTTEDPTFVDAIRRALAFDAAIG